MGGLKTQRKTIIQLNQQQRDLLNVPLLGSVNSYDVFLIFT